MRALRPLIPAFLAALGGVCALPSAASADVYQNESLPIDRLRFVDCLNEYVHLTGSVHFLYLETTDATGGWHAAYQAQPANVVGTSESGLSYRGAGVTRESWDLNSGAWTKTFEDEFLLIGLDGAPDLRDHEVTHVTRNPDGTVIIDDDNSFVTCE